MVEISASAFLIMLSIKWALKKTTGKSIYQIILLDKWFKIFFQIIPIRQWFKNDSI